jgi:hypothetical protein
MQRILSMPSATVETNLAAQPEETREQAHRLISAAVEGQFDLDARE